METDLDVVSIVLVYPDGTRRREQHRSDKTIGDLLADVRANSTMAELHSVVLRDRSAELSGDSNALPASMKLKKVHGHCLVVHMTNRVNSVMRGTTSAARPFCTHHKMAGACTRCVNDPAYQLRRAGFEVRESDSGLVVSFEYEGFRHQWVMTDPGNAALGGAVQRARGVKRAVCQMIENNVHRDRAMQAELDAIDMHVSSVQRHADDERALQWIKGLAHRFAGASGSTPDNGRDSVDAEREQNFGTEEQLTATSVIASSWRSLFSEAGEPGGDHERPQMREGSNIVRLNHATEETADRRAKLEYLLGTSLGIACVWKGVDLELCYSLEECEYRWQIRDAMSLDDARLEEYADAVRGAFCAGVKRRSGASTDDQKARER